MKHIPYYHADVFSNKPLSGNGLIVFTETDEFSTAFMQRLTQEMRQFESIFLQKLAPSKFRAKVFTCEEEVDFAGHPVIGAAAIVHDLYRSDTKKAEWQFQLNYKTVNVTTIYNGTSYEALMNQGVTEFGKTLDEIESQEFLTALNLEKDDLMPGYLPTVVSTGLPYLLLPLQKNGLKAKIKVSDLEERMKPFGAKFIGILEVSTRSIRTWDNAGIVEDIATGSLAGPSAAWLVKNGFEKANSIIQINQGQNLGRPSQLFADVKEAGGKLTDVFVGGSVVKFAHGFLEADVLEENKISMQENRATITEGH